jgi:dimethylhistidine N-methyltransferase
MTRRSDEEPLLRDFEPAREAFLAEALQGLQQTPRLLPCKYLYDAEGSKLFERICELEEYYPTRTELEIMRRHAGEMAEALGTDVMLVEYGSGSSAKTRLLLDHLPRPAAYVPVDISREPLLEAASMLAMQYPDLEVLPVCADFTRRFALPEPSRAPRRTAVYFPGSTIGNFTRERAVALLAEVRALVGPSGAALVGADLVKSRHVLERAYDDAEGVTAAFNLNLLRRMNRELGADFDLDAFSHRAVWVEAEGRIEMHLVSAVDQTARVGDLTLHLERGERICTEHSHKYSLQGFAEMARWAGLDVARVWTDAERLFSVQLLCAA